MRVLVDGIGSGYFFPAMARRLRRAGVPVGLFMHSALPWRMPNRPSEKRPDWVPPPPRAVVTRTAPSRVSRLVRSGNLRVSSRGIARGAPVSLIAFEPSTGRTTRGA